MKKCVIIVPVYKEELTSNELKSFSQGCNIFSNYGLTLVTYNGLNIDFYKKIANRFQCPIKIELFDKDYFSSIVGYNRMTYSKDFYQRFCEYEYMLIYQTDAYVFGDELEYWCSQGYDYIGAPIYIKACRTEYTSAVEGVGNGGFCIRKPSYCLRILNYPKYLPFLTPKGVWYLDTLFLNRSDVRMSKLRVLLVRLFSILKMLGVRNNISYLTSSGRVNEDYLYSIYASLSWLPVNLPTVDEAARFSIEMNPSFWFERNGNKLPFGCHAFEKYDFKQFWEQFIK